MLTKSALSFIFWIAFLDVKRRYMRTVFGFSWNTLTFLIFILALSLVWSKLWGVDVQTYLPYLASGIVCWNFISNTINDSTGSLKEFGALLKDKNIPYEVLSWIIILRNIYISLPNVLLVFVINAFLLEPSLTTSLFWLLICFPAVIYLLNIVAVCLSYICLRFPDVRQLVSTLMLILIFVTPVLWSMEQISSRAGDLLLLNPFVHILDLLRAGLMFEYPHYTSWMFLLGFIPILHVLKVLIRKILKPTLWIYL